MKRHKMIAKGCPECEQQVPVACKACPCGYSFFNAKRAQQTQLSVVDDVVRRTQRVRREKPDYYDSLQYDRRLRRARARNSECDIDDDGVKRDSSKAKRRRLRREEEEDEDMMNSLSSERQLQCALILEELNRKLRVVTWKPPDD